MSQNLDEPGPSGSKRKSSDSFAQHEVNKIVAEDRSISPTSSNDDPLEGIPSDEDSTAKLGDYLSAQYEVLLRVLNNLTAFDLRRAAQVCKSWNSAARVVRDSRKQCNWLFWRVNNVGYNVPAPLALYLPILEHVYSQPTVCIAFYSKTAKNSYKCVSLEEDKIICPVSKSYQSCGMQHPMESYMSWALGPKCEIMSFSVSGVIGSAIDLQSTFEVEHTKGGVQSMSAALFPDIPGAKLVRFKMSRQELKDLYKCPTPQSDLAERLNLPSNMLLQALVLFGGYRIPVACVSALVEHLQARQEHRFALAGGIVEKTDSLEGLAICGDNVCAASLVINETVTEKDSVVEQVFKLKNCNMPADRSFCFMFTCLGRGQNWYLGDKDVESSIINKIFPTTPVVGFFGRGEIGLNFLPNFEAQESKVFWSNWKALCAEALPSLQAPSKDIKRSTFDVEHSYSTCILYLSFNTANQRLPL